MRLKGSKEKVERVQTLQPTPSASKTFRPSFKGWGFAKVGH